MTSRMAGLPMGPLIFSAYSQQFVYKNVHIMRIHQQTLIYNYVVDIAKNQLAEMFIFFFVTIGN